MSIQYIKNKDINIKKYTDCLVASYNANAFAYPWYLDLVCDDWDLLMEDDYATVCPLPLQRHLGFTFLSQPLMAPLLGVFSSKELPPLRINSFMKAIPYWNVKLTLNHFNRLQSPSIQHTQSLPVLDLIRPYQLIRQTYSPQAQQLLDQPTQISILRTIQTKEYINFTRSIYKTNKKSLLKLTRIMNYALRYKSAGIYTVYSSSNELIAALFLIKTNHRIFLIDTVENQEGKENHALFRGVDHIIKNNSESDLTLELPFEHQNLTTAFPFTTQHCLQYTKGIFTLFIQKA